MGEVKLDIDTFKALAGETRVDILKSLKERKKYLAELSKELELSNSSVKEHLDTLNETGLIEKEDNGRKWKYYRLTKKGEKVMSSKGTKAYIMLSISILASLAGGILFIKNQLVRGTAESVRTVGGALKDSAPKMTEGPKVMSTQGANKTASAAGETMNQTMSKSSAEAINYASPEFALMIIGLILLTITLIWIIKRR